MFAVQALGLEHRLAGDIGPQTAQDGLVHGAEDHGRVDVTAPDVVKFRQRAAGEVAVGGADLQSYHDLAGVDPGIPTAQMLCLQRLDGFDGLGGQQFYIWIDAGQSLQSIQEHRGTSPQKR